MIVMCYVMRFIAHFITGAEWTLRGGVVEVVSPVLEATPACGITPLVDEKPLRLAVGQIDVSGAGLNLGMFGR